MSDAPGRGGHVSATRAIGILARTGHLLAMALLLGGAFAGVGQPALRGWAGLTAATGLALLATEVSHGREWPWQACGVASVAHVAAFGLLAWLGMERAGCVAALVIGAVGSHLPRTLRRWSFRRGRVVEPEPRP